jgi:aryl-alcohol dehydrogenase-like predicted oxidoreductase
MQNHYNLIYREEEREMNPLCEAEGIGLIPWSPLARGVLAGNRKAGTIRSKTDSFGSSLYGEKTAEADQRVIEALEKLSHERGTPPAQIALAWLMHKPAMTAPIVGASKPQHLEDAIAAVDVKLSAAEITRLEEAYIPHEIAGHAIK